MTDDDLVDDENEDKMSVGDKDEGLTDSQLDLGSFGQEDATCASFWFLIA